MSNIARLARALPKLLRAFLSAPQLCFQLLQSKEYSYRASSLSGIYRLAKLARHPDSFDVLHAHFGPAGNSYRFARSLWRAPLIVSFHGYDFSTLPRREGANMYEKLFSTVDAITVNSQYTRRQVEQLGCPPEKIHQLPVGLHPEEFQFRVRTLKDGEPLRILSVGRLVEIKGHEYLLRALAKLREKNPALQCDIAGDGPLRKELEGLIQQLGLQEMVRLHGAVDSTKVTALMANAHIFVLASVNVQGDQEGQGLVLQEAQACGLPIITTQHGALPEGILPGESGFLVPERDHDALAERLHYLGEHPDLWPKMGTVGRRFVEQNYDVCRLNCQLVGLYQQTIEEYRHHNA